MTLKTYQAKTMAEALAQVKHDLGRDAVILQTRNVRKGGLLGLWRRPIWEVTASANVNVPRRIDEGRYVSDSARADASADKAAIATAPPPAADAPPAPAPAAPATDEADLSGRVEDIRRMLATLLRRPAQAPEPAQTLGPELEEFRELLLAQEVRRELVDGHMQKIAMGLTGQQLADRSLIRRELKGLLAGSIRIAADPRPVPPDRARVIALIGPTGVGKTTTIAKLAANYKLSKGKRVGLITIDTYRIAAVDQLRTYADIIEVPLRAVLTAGELHQAVRAMRGLDIVLIDTAGRSQNNRLRLSQLRSFLAAAQPDEVHLVVSATANQKVTAHILDRFVPLGANQIIVTKLDEAAAFGVLMNVSAAGGGPLSYVTTGQDVPEDIARASAEDLAECVLTGHFGEDLHVG